MGADQHIGDDDDRAELAALAYELYGQHGSFRKVREYLAREPATLRICGHERLFSMDTIRTWVDMGRTAEAYLGVAELAKRYADSETRLQLLSSLVWEWKRIHGIESADELFKMVDTMVKIEGKRIDLLRLQTPTRVQIEDGESVEMPPNVVAMIEALARRNVARSRALVAENYPGPAIPARPTRKRRNA